MGEYTTRQPAHAKWWVGGIVAMAICVAASGVAVWHNSSKGNPASPSTPFTSQQQVNDPIPVATSSNMLFFGNAFWGRRTNAWAMASDLKYAYPFSGLHGFDRSKYDAWIAGLECPSVAGLTLSPYQEETLLSFNCNPEYLPEAAKWFTVFTLANNHTDNQGADGFAETQRHLDEHGIQYFGHYDPKNLENTCDIIAMPAKATMDDKSIRETSLPVALCGYHGFLQLPPAESIAIMQRYAKYLPVIAMPHMGVEYKPAADAIRTNLYRAMIDNGADMVLGDHPHWVQNAESYKGHLIVYSMGNFMFDQQGSLELTRSAGINVLMSVEQTDQRLLQQWISLADTCKRYHDDCLDQAERQQLAKLPYSYKFGVIGTDASSKVTKPATTAVHAGILDRLRWEQTVGQLQAPYGSL